MSGGLESHIAYIHLKMAQLDHLGITMFIRHVMPLSILPDQEQKLIQQSMGHSPYRLSRGTFL